MTFKQLQDAVLADGFAESKRSDAKNWINFRLGWIWDLDEWTFAKGSSAVTVTAGSQVVTGIPADCDYSAVTGLYRADGQPLIPIESYNDFARLYVGTGNNQQGPPEAFCVYGSSIFVGPTSSETTAAYLLLYEKAPTLLVADGDIPAIPPQYHLALVHGAKAEGFKLSNVPLADAFDADFQAAINAMRRKYLVSVRGAGTQVPRYTPGG